MNIQPTGDGGYAWSPPASLPAAVIEEAGRAAHALGMALATAPSGVKLEWLNKLGILMAGTMPLPEVKARIGAYAQGLDHPELCFTEATRFAAGRRFKFWPAFNELAQFLDEIAAEPRAALRRLNRVATATAAREPKPAEHVVRPDWRKLKRSELTAAELALFEAEAGGVVDRIRTALGAA